MNSKLEEKLLQYQIANKQELLHAVESILEEESNKSTEQDIDLIDEAVNVILTLNGVDTDELDVRSNILIDKILSDDRVNAVVAKPNKIKVIRIKWLIPAAVILSLLVSATLVAYAMGYDVLSMTGDAFKQLNEKVWYGSEDKSLVVSNDNRRYANYDEMIENDSFENILWPSQVDDNNYTSDILVTDLGEYTQILCEFNIHEETIKYTVRLSYNFSAINIDAVSIGNFNVYINEYDNLLQADFVYEENMYTIVSFSYDSLEDFIKTLEEK